MTVEGGTLAGPSLWERLPSFSPVGSCAWYKPRGLLWERLLVTADAFTVVSHC